MIKLELISPTNAPVFKDIRLRALQESPTAFSSTYTEESTLTDADWLKRAAQWSSAKSVAYLALDNDAAVGIAAGVLDRNYPLRADLMSMWVAPTHRGTGIGRLWVNAIVAWVCGHSVLHLYVMVTSNNDRAIAFYQNLGFVLTGRSKP
jgi:GNAT superfamily N-acetyltransferase